ALAHSAGATAFPARGYPGTGRPGAPTVCGFDVGNHNGTFGEAADCNVLCNGATPTHSITIDGTAGQLQWFVNCDTGNDSNDGSSAANATNAIQGMLNKLPAPGASVGQWLCIKGTCNVGTGEPAAGIVPTQSGDSGTYSWSQGTGDARAFTLPKFPLGMVCWD